MAEQLEAAGNRKDTALILEKTGELLEKYRSYIEILAPWCVSQEKIEVSEKTISVEELQRSFDEMQRAVEDLDMDTLEAVLEKLGSYQFFGNDKDYYDRIKDAAADFDVETCEHLIKEWKEKER